MIKKHKTHSSGVLRKQEDWNFYVVPKTGDRWDLTMFNPFTGSKTQVVKFAAMVRTRTWTKAAVGDWWADHNRGDCGWQKLEWSKLCFQAPGVHTPAI